MVKITQNEIKQLRAVGTGSFGTVYQKDDKTAYKIYHPYLCDCFGNSVSNPALSFSRRRLSLLKKRGKELQFVKNPILDILFVDHHFGGVVIPYYDGTLLCRMMKVPFSLKYNIAKQFLENGKDLTDHKIYPKDYKLDNVLYENGIVRILDLDDYYTPVCHFPNRFHERRSIRALSETIYTYFGEYHYPCYNKSVCDYLLKKPRDVLTTYHDIECYLQEKNVSHNYLLIHEDSDLSLIKKLLNCKDYRVLFVFCNYFMKDDELLKTFDRFSKNHVSLYDMVSSFQLDSYLLNENTDDVLEVSLKTLQKKRI